MHSFDAKRSRFHSKSNKAAAFIHAGMRAGKCYKFLFLTNKDRLQLFCYKLCFVINVLNDKTKNNCPAQSVTEYRLILANSACGLVG